MSQMLTNIRRVVEEDVSNRTTQMNVLYEAITNAIHAKANKIVCRLTSDQDVIETNEGGIVPRKVTVIEVEDNGDGFNNANYESFGRHKTDYKVELGCKGVGRFVFLKVFENVKYTSLLAGIKKKREFSFGFDFESDNLNEEDAEVSENKTLLRLTGVTASHFNKDRHTDRRLDLNLSEIKERVLAHLIPTLFLYKQKKVSICIDFCDTGTGGTASITDGDIPNFKTEDFSVQDAGNKAHPFVLYYKISEEAGSLNAFHCANKRTVCEFSDKDLKISLPNKFTGYFLLESDYFNNHVNNERNELEIFPVKSDAFCTLSWEMINRDLKKVISSLVKISIPDAVEMNRAKLADIQEERPYLADYIEPEDLEIAGFVDKRHIIKKAKKRFDDAKEKLLSHAGKSEYTDKDLEEAIQITQNELVVYVKDRVLVIERLKKMMVDKEQSEKIIHNLFMERFTDDNYFSSGKNNLWLLDDRFTSYSYAASEKSIEEIIQKVKLEEGAYVDKDRPDLALFFSHDPVDKKALKSVLIELKSFKDGGKSDREKFAGLQQLLDYIKAFKAKDDIKEIWAFLVTDVDDKFAERLKTDTFTPLFSTDKAIYYRYYEKINAFIYVFGVQTLISDAEARNKTFIEIINKHSRLNKLLTAELTSTE
jgi:hypothetical protein